MSGQIQGGWEYIWAAYGVAWTGLTLYAVSLWARRPRFGSGGSGGSGAGSGVGREARP